MKGNKKIAAGSALAFIVLMGIVSCFSDMTHEGASSITGAFLALAGANAVAIGFISGLGEFVGYSLRLLTGYITDKTKHYWTITIIGYIIDMLAIPMLALVPHGGWILACGIMIAERAGKAIKKPAKDTLVSFAAVKEGTGKSFAIQEFLDQIGAFVGPVILFIVMLLRGHAGAADCTSVQAAGNAASATHSVINSSAYLFSSYKVCFAVLGIPAITTIVLLLFAKRKFPNPEKFEPDTEKSVGKIKLSRGFIFYIVAMSLSAMGFVDFNLITMHTAKNGLVSGEILPLLYALAMMIDAFAALFFGWLYDKRGFKTLIVSTVIAAPFAILAFTATSQAALICGVILWGIGMGAQESVVKSAVADMVPKERRSTGFGIFQASYGLFWFLGSWLMGWLYDWNMTAMIIFSVVSQLAAIPFLWMSSRPRYYNS
jgi:MFS family permease